MVGQTGTENFIANCESPPPQMQGKGVLFPSDVECSRGYNALRPELIFLANSKGLPAGLYSFELSVKTPPGATIGTGGKPFPTRWAFYTYSNIQTEVEYQAKTGVKEWRTSTVTDKEMWTEKPYINKRMLAATLEEPPTTTGGEGRDDRPMHDNRVVISFALADAPSLGVSDFIIRAPLGFQFREDCLRDIVTTKNLVFGSSANAEDSKRLNAFVDWPSGMAPTDCKATGNVASSLSQRALLLSGSKKTTCISCASASPTQKRHHLWAKRCGCRKKTQMRQNLKRCTTSGPSNSVANPQSLFQDLSYGP
jgi:hypothetical protein